MSNYKYGDWYCKPANEEEALEIVERAVASGAEIHETVGLNGDRGEYEWDLLVVWGVLDGRTLTGNADEGCQFCCATEHTIAQVREKFPLPGEEVKTGWDSEGLPLVGTECEKVYTSPDEYYRVKILAHDDGEVVFRWLDGPNESDISASRQYQFGGYNMKAHMCFRPTRTDRELWVEQALEHEADTIRDMLGSIYDALKSGTLKAPKVE